MTGGVRRPHLLPSVVSEHGFVVAPASDPQLGAIWDVDVGDAATFVRVDVSSEEEVAAAIDAAVERFGRLDCVVNNAGILGAVGPIAEIDGAAWRRTVAVLLDSVFYGTKHAARVMIGQGSGGAIVLDLPDAHPGDPMNIGSATKPLHAAAAKKRSVLRHR